MDSGLLIISSQIYIRKICQASRNQSDKYVREETGGQPKDWKNKDTRWEEVKGYVARMDDRLWLKMN